jgi:hypothetical protein
LIPDRGLRAVRLAAIALAVFCLFAAFLASGCASVPSNASAHSPSAPGSDPPPTVTPPPQPAISVSVAPASITVQPGQTQSFTATVANDPQNKGVSWSLSNCGPGACGVLSANSSASGVAVTYTAPPQMPASSSVILTATPIADPAKPASAAITIAAPAAAISVSVSPQAQTLTVNQTQNFAATVQNDAQNKGVSWSISGTNCTKNSCGTLSSTSTASGASITYTAPAQVPNPPTITLVATSVANSNVSASAAISIAVPAAKVAVVVSPPSQAVQVNRSQAFTATVQNDSQNKGVTWTLSGAGCAAAVCGTLSSVSSASGAPITYTAPANAPNPATVSLTATSVADSTVSASAAITIAAPAPQVKVVVSPPSQTVQVNQSQAFAATVQNDPQNKGVTWTLTGAGCAGVVCGTLSNTLSPSGAPITYTAPANAPNPATVTLTATSVADLTVSASAVIAIAAPPVLIVVAVSPPSQTVQVAHSQAFTATVQNDSQNKGVTWTLSGPGCAGAVCGMLSSSSSASGAPITYTAPANAPNPATVTLTATSVADRRSSVNVTITIFAIPANLSVVISPKRGGITLSQTLKFSATVQNDPSNQGVTWTASSGTFTNVMPTSATYLPPTTPGVYTVTATSALDVTKTAAATIGVTDLSGVTTYHNDSTRAGVNSQEFALTPSNVSTSTFAKLFSCAVDAPVYPQTLWVANLSIAGGTHNVIFTATSHSTVYAFDADANPCVTYWSKQLIPSGETWPTATDMGSQDVQPDVGIVGTPVIDPLTKILYVVTKTKNVGTDARGPGKCHQRLHALNLADGSETANGPFELTSAITVPGSGDGSNGTLLPFDPFHENQRAGLALANGTVYVAWGSHTDQTPWHGWIIGFNKSDLRATPMLFNATPNGSGAGIWMSGGAPAVDTSNNLYAMTGNGDYNGVTEFGDSFLKVNASLALQDWFTPVDQASLNTSNYDLGSGAAAVLADLPSAPVKHLLIGGGKAGTAIYVLNRDAMGHLEGTGSPVVQKILLNRSIYATPAFWNNTMYIAGVNSGLLAYALDPATGLFNTTPVSSSSLIFQERGATASVSSKGNSQGIAWVADTRQWGPLSDYGAGPAVLHAYDATNLSRELWNSAQAAANRDLAGNAVKFTVPTIANGKVYIGSFSEIDVYGLLPD